MVHGNELANRGGRRRCSIHLHDCKFDYAVYFFSSEWVAYPREWKMTEDDVPVASKSSFTYMTYNILCDGMMRWRNLDLS